MVACIGFCKSGEFPGSSPVKASAVHNDPAYRGSVSADEFGGGMDHDISAILNGAYQIRGCKGIIDYQRDLVAVRNVRNGFYVRNV